MTFLTPALLALGVAVAVPLILHLFHRHQGPRLVFPAVRYLRRAEREHATRIRLRQLLLLALRMLAVVLLAGAAARPFIPGVGDAHEPTAVAIVLDNSMSSGAVRDDRRVLDDLKAGARQTLAAAGADDRFWLIRAGEPWEPAFSGGVEEMSAAVAAVRPAAGGSDLAASLARAAAVLDGAGARAREIHLFSDLQAAAFGAVGAGDPTPVPVRVLAPTWPPPVNRTVTSVQIGAGLPPRAGARSTVSATVAGDPGEDAVSVRLTVDGSVRAVASAAVGTAVVLPFPARPPGLVIGHVEIDRDALAADDRRHFAVPVVPPPAVAVGATLPFLEEALTVLAEAGRLQRTGAEIADVIIAPGGRGAEAVRLGAGVVVLPPTTALELAATNRRLEDAAIPWRFETPAAGEGRIDPAGLEPAEALGDVRLRQVYGLARVGPERPGARDSVVVRLRSGEPWAVRGRAGDAGPYVLLATPLTAEAGTLPTSTAMLPLLERAVMDWAATAPTASAYSPGEVVEIPGGALERPDGSVETLPRGSRVRLTDAGVYRLRADDELVAAFAVNPPPSESELTPLPGPRVAVAIGGDVRVAGPSEWGDVIFHRRLGREVTTLLLIAGLAVLLLESAAAAGGRGP